MIAETPVRHDKFLVLVFLSVCVRRDSGRKNYRISLKFGRNVYALYKIRCVTFGVHYINSACTGIQKCISIRCGLRRDVCYIPVCPLHGSRHRYHTIRLECGTNGYMLC